VGIDHPDCGGGSCAREEAMTNEEIYDAEIAPELARICKRCQELGFAFVASVEYDAPNAGRGKTEYQPATKPIRLVSSNQLLVHWAARADGNVDKLFMAIDRWAKEHGHSSMYLSLLGNKNVQYSDHEFAAIMITTP
jgi:hypothetical protein